MKQTLTLNKRAFELILTQCGMKKSLYEAGTDIKSFETDEYSAVREGLIMSGICRLDFDGKLHFISLELSRFIYCIKNAAAAMFYKNDDTLTVFLKSPVDITRLSYSEDEVTISSQAYTATYKAVDRYINDMIGYISVIGLNDEDENVYSTDLSSDEKKHIQSIVGKFMISGVKFPLDETEHN